MASRSAQKRRRHGLGPFPPTFYCGHHAWGGHVYLSHRGGEYLSLNNVIHLWFFNLFLVALGFSFFLFLCLDFGSLSLTVEKVPGIQLFEVERGLSYHQANYSQWAELWIHWGPLG